MSETNETITEVSEAEDDLISAALVHGGSYREAAEAAGVSKATVGRRMQDPIFRSAVEHERMSALHRAGHRLGNLTDLALDAYAEVLESEDATVGQRLKAADGVLSAFRSMSVEVAAAHRFAAIEERLSNSEELRPSNIINIGETQ